MTIRNFSGPNAFLSNFWPVVVSYEDDAYRSVEHAYQAAKFPHAVRFDFFTGSAGSAKRKGRRPGRRADWEQVKVGIMADLLKQKFAYPDLRARLTATGDEELVEGNTWGDVFWGVDMTTGTGINTLGRLLMIERDRK